MSNAQHQSVSVAFVVGGLPYGGIEIGLLDLLTHLDANRFKTCVINLSGAGNLTPRFQEHGVQLINMQLRLSTHRLDTTWRLRRLLQQLDPDVLVTSQFSANYHARLAALGLRAKVLTYAHNTKSERYWERRLADRILGRYGTHRFLAVSRQVQIILASQVPASAGKTALTYNAVAADRLQPPAGYHRERFRQQEGIHASHFLVMAIGRAVRQKGFDLLLQAFQRVSAEIPDARLLIAGDGAMLPDLERLVDHLRLRQCVRLLGYRTDVAALLKACDVFVLPSRWEGLGIVALEALALGAPMVLTETSPITEALTHGETGWIAPCEPEAIAAGILALRRDPALRRQMARRGQTLFEQNFTMTAYAQKIARLIGEAAPR